jgi:hypothetical protein
MSDWQLVTENADNDGVLARKGCEQDGHDVDVD